MLTQLWQRIEAFEDTPLAGVLGIASLMLIVYFTLLLPEPGVAVMQ